MPPIGITIFYLSVTTKENLKKFYRKHLIKDFYKFFLCQSENKDVSHVF